jgi:hypothetical protein
MANASDSIVLYLLQGAPDPSLATSKLRLANLTRMTKGFGAPMRDTGNFAIPPTPGTSYIAFKYYSVHDWFQVYIDSIYISGNPLTITQDPDKSENPVKVYPNPANTTIGVLFTNKSVGHTTVSILNAYGKEIFTRKYLPGASTADIAINQLPSGIYYLGTTTDGAEQNFQKFEIVR